MSVVHRLHHSLTFRIYCVEVHILRVFGKLKRFTV